MYKITLHKKPRTRFILPGCIDTKEERIVSDSQDEDETIEEALEPVDEENAYAEENPCISENLLEYEKYSAEKVDENAFKSSLFDLSDYNENLFLGISDFSSISSEIEKQNENDSEVINYLTKTFNITSKEAETLVLSIGETDELIKAQEKILNIASQNNIIFKEVEKVEENIIVEEYKYNEEYYILNFKNEHFVFIYKKNGKYHIKDSMENKSSQIKTINDKILIKDESKQQRPYSYSCLGYALYNYDQHVKSLEYTIGR